MDEMQGKDHFERLRALLQQEVALMREALANFHQEEFSLLLHEKESWIQVMTQRSDMVMNLCMLRQERIAATIRLQEFVKEKLKKETLSFQELFLQEEVVSAEIASLLDQIFALMQKLNQQNCRNDVLFYELKQAGDAFLQCPYPPQSPAPKPKKAKTTTTTYTNHEKRGSDL